LTQLVFLRNLHQSTCFGRFIDHFQVFYSNTLHFMLQCIRRLKSSSWNSLYGMPHSNYTTWIFSINITFSHFWKYFTYLLPDTNWLRYFISMEYNYYMKIYIVHGCTIQISTSGHLKAQSTSLLPEARQLVLCGQRLHL